jgi:hypothetical protein
MILTDIDRRAQAQSRSDLRVWILLREDYVGQGLQVERERERERERRARRRRAVETNGEKEETRKTEKRENKKFFGIFFKKILKVKILLKEFVVGCFYIGKKNSLVP